MKKLLAIMLVATSLSVGAFFNSNNMPWNFNNNNGYNNGYQEDNGMFGYNPYDYWDPRWYMEEMSNMVDEFDDEFSNNNNGWGGNNYNRGNNNFNPNQPFGFNANTSPFGFDTRNNPNQAIPVKINK